LADDRSPRDADTSALDARIAAARKANERPMAVDGQSEGRGWAVGIEFVGTVLVSALIGWLIDRYAGLSTAPWAMIVLLLLGFAAGTRRAMQTSKQFDSDPND
jgi:ATP synthase protein I